MRRSRRSPAQQLGDRPGTRRGMPRSVLDEPTSSLSQTDTRRLFALIAELKRTGHAIVYISHFIEEVKTIADRIVVLRDGKVAAEATPILRPRHRAADGRPAGRRAVSPIAGRRSAILELSAFGPSSATLTLHRGARSWGLPDCLAGRTRLIRGTSASKPCAPARVRIGAWSGTATPKERWHQGIGFLSEDRKEEGLAAALSIADNLTLTRLEGLGPGPMVLSGRRIARRRGGWSAWKSSRKAHVRLSPSCRQGQQVALARLLHHDVDVLLLDEPTRGIDVASKAQIHHLIDTLVSEHQMQRALEEPRAVLMTAAVPELLAADRLSAIAVAAGRPRRSPVCRGAHRALADARGDRCAETRR